MDKKTLMSVAKVVIGTGQVVLSAKAAFLAAVAQARSPMAARSGTVVPRCLRSCQAGVQRVGDGLRELGFRH